jgi:hypothetical protein
MHIKAEQHEYDHDDGSCRAHPVSAEPPNDDYDDGQGRADCMSHPVNAEPQDDDYDDGQGRADWMSHPVKDEPQDDDYDDGQGRADVMSHPVKDEPQDDDYADGHCRADWIEHPVTDEPHDDDDDGQGRHDDHVAASHDDHDEPLLMSIMKNIRMADEVKYDAESHEQDKAVRTRKTKVRAGRVVQASMRRSWKQLLLCEYTRDYVQIVYPRE